MFKCGEPRREEAYDTLVDFAGKAAIFKVPLINFTHNPILLAENLVTVTKVSRPSSLDPAVDGQNTHVYVSSGILMPSWIDRPMRRPPSTVSRA